VTLEAPQPEEDPHWLRDALAMPLVVKARAMGSALWLFERKPRVFGEAWFRGNEKLPNPVVAMAASVSILTILRQELHRFGKRDEAPHTLLTSLGETLGPYLMYVGLGLLAHAALRVFGSKRKLRTTIGVCLLAGAGPGLVLALGMTLAGVWMVTLYGAGNAFDPKVPAFAGRVIACFVLGLYAHFLLVFQLALAGAHGLPRWKGLGAGMVAVVAIAFLCGWIENASWWSKAGIVLGPHAYLRLREAGLHFD
jgi:hypothetical protein